MAASRSSLDLFLLVEFYENAFGANLALAVSLTFLAHVASFPPSVRPEQVHFASEYQDIFDVAFRKEDR